MYALDVVDLKKTYGTRVEALKGISLTVEEGDFFALLGPNGAGKSTLIGIAASLVRPSSGDIKVFGKSVVTERSAAVLVPPSTTCWLVTTWPSASNTKPVPWAKPWSPTCTKIETTELLTCA